VIAIILAAATAATAMDEYKAPPGRTDISSPIHQLKVSELRASFNELHNGHRHEAIDIMHPRGTPVHAVIRGTIRKLHWSRAGRNIVYEFDGTGEYCYYYAHLDHYAPGLIEGKVLHRGDVIGYVGSTGNAPANSQITVDRPI